jgi:hypothetical protein
MNESEERKEEREKKKEITMIKRLESLESESQLWNGISSSRNNNETRSWIRFSPAKKESNESPTE